MKQSLLYLLMILFFAACGEGQGDNARISGTIKGLGTDTIYIYGEDQMFDKVDTLFINKDKFKKNIAVDTLAQAWMLFRNGQRFPIFLNKRSDIKIKGDTININNLQVEDNGENHLLTTFRNTHDSTLTVAAVDTFITQYPQSTVGLYLINSLLKQSDLEERKDASKLLNKIDESLNHYPQYLRILELSQTEAKTDTGTSVPYFRLKNLEGRWISRANYNKKWLLIHFWASWNEPSKLQNRSMFKPLYRLKEKEKIQDFDMLGISLDVDKKEWQKAIEKDTLKWEQVSDFKSWLTEAVSLFNIRHLPANVLLSPDGKIKAFNLTKEQVEEKLAELKEEQKSDSKNKENKKNSK